MGELKGSRTEENLHEAFVRESQANRRYLYFAQRADIEGYPDVAALFRAVADGSTGHAFGHLDFLLEDGADDGATVESLRDAIERETHDHGEMYPSFAATAREEGLIEVAEWLDTLGRAEGNHAGRLAEGLASFG